MTTNRYSPAKRRRSESTVLMTVTGKEPKNKKVNFSTLLQAAFLRWSSVYFLDKYSEHIVIHMRKNSGKISYKEAKMPYKEVKMPYKEAKMPYKEAKLPYTELKMTEE